MTTFAGDTYANAQWTSAAQTALAVDWTTEVDGNPLTQRIIANAISGLIHYDAIVAQGLVIADAPPAIKEIDPLAALQAALVAKGVITDGDVNAAAATLAQPADALPMTG